MEPVKSSTPSKIQIVSEENDTGLDRPLGLQEVQALRISKQSEYEGGKFVIPMDRPHLPSGDSPSTHFC
jgi:hypothetical protein